MCESPAIEAGLRNDAEPSMVCSADDLVGWRDFPKGLRVLLLVEDSSSATDIKSKLEQMDYIVSLFSDEKEALVAVSSKVESFHVAIVEVTTGNSVGCFRFLEGAKGLPTIMVSEAQCISTMIKCIALGAAEFLQKPLSEEKLRNIWQHVVHKAFNAGSTTLSKSLKPIKETVASILQLQPDAGTAELTSMADVTKADEQTQGEHEGSPPNDRFPAPPTPQLEQSSRSLDNTDWQDQLNCSMEVELAKDSMEQANICFSESKSLDNTTCNNSTGEFCKVEPSAPADFSMEDEIDSAYGSKNDECAAPGEQCMPPHLNDQGHVKLNPEVLNQRKASLHHNNSSHACGHRANKKRIKVDWTPDLHKRFVQAVEQLGIDQAIPSKILELMKVEGLTRHNVASHLQKYRMRKRHILPKDDDRRWQQHGKPVPRAYPYKPFVALPPAHSGCGLPPAQVYPVWGHPNYHHPGIQMWANTGFSPWQPSAEYWPWKTYPRMNADAWGCPVVPPQNPYPAMPQYPPQTRSFDAPEHRNGASRDAYDFCPNYKNEQAEEVIDEVVREALRKPWLPLPLGLKPPSTDSVLAELHRVGIHSVPPR